MKRCIVLFSGGLDSTTVAAIAKADGFQVCALSFAYGQRHSVELEAAKRVVKSLGIIDHRTVDLDLRAFVSSSLLANIDVPKNSLDETIPNTYVPGRNTIFLSFGLAFAEVMGACDIFYGANAIDYSGYPDCRPEYLDAFSTLANLATKAGVEGTRTRVHAPLLQMTKADIIRKGHALGVDFSLTHSCYDPVGDLACGECDSCLIRRRGFEAACVPDPTRYVSRFA